MDAKIMTAGKTEDIELKLLLEAIFYKYHYDFRGYSMASIKRRLKQSKDRFNCSSYSQLQDKVLHDQTLLPELLSYLTVQVSEFFRDLSYYP
jgi:chemotaxis protein methyltransferase CheR